MLGLCKYLSPTAHQNFSAVVKKNTASKCFLSAQRVVDDAVITHKLRSQKSHRYIESIGDSRLQKTRKVGYHDRFVMQEREDVFEGAQHGLQTNLPAGTLGTSSGILPLKGTYSLSKVRAHKVCQKDLVAFSAIYLYRICLIASS